MPEKKSVVIKADGCLVPFGVIAISCAVGSIWGESYGWLIAGVLCVVLGLIYAMFILASGSKR